MVYGVNGQGFNYYNLQQMQNNGQPVNMTGSAIFNQQQAANVKRDNVADGKDDGSIGFGAALKNIGKGAVKFFTGMFTDKDGNFSLGQTIKTAAIAAGVGAVCVLTAGTAVPAVIAAAGVATSGLGLGKAAFNAATATTDAEAEAAFQSIGSNGVALGLSAAGAKAAVKSNPANAEAVNAGKFDGATGTLKAVGQAFKDATSPIKASVKDVNLSEGVGAAASKIRNNVTEQASAFGKTVKGNYEATIFGTKGKVANESENIQKEIDANKEKMADIKDTTSKSYKDLQAKNAKLEAQKTIMDEINKAKSYNEGYSKIDELQTKLAEKKAALSKEGADKTKIQGEIDTLESAIKSGKEVLSRRTQEAQYIRSQIETKQKALANAKDAKVKESIQKDIESLIDKQDFEVNAGNVKLSDVRKSQTDALTANLKVKKAEANLKAAQEKLGKVDKADAKAVAEAQRDVRYAQQALKNEQYFQSLDNKVASFNSDIYAASGKKYIANNILKAAKAKLTEGSWKSNLRHQNNESQWLTVGLAGRQFGYTADNENSFYSQLTPEMQAQYNQLSDVQKQQLLQAYAA